MHSLDDSVNLSHITLNCQKLIQFNVIIKYYAFIESSNLVTRFYS